MTPTQGELARRVEAKFNHCPFCGSDELDASDYDGTRTLTLTATCTKCDATWYEHYAFTHATDFEDGKGVTAPDEADQPWQEKLSELASAPAEEVDRELLGWNESSKLVLAERFAAEMGLTDLYEKFLDQQAVSELTSGGCCPGCGEKVYKDCTGTDRCDNCDGPCSCPKCVGEDADVEDV